MLPLLSTASLAQSIAMVPTVQEYGNGLTFEGIYDRPPLVGDFDGDGRKDLLRLDVDRSWVLTGRSDGVFDVESVDDDYAFPSTAWSSFAGDFTGDGSSDVAFTGLNQVWLHESSDFDPWFSWFTASWPNGWSFGNVTYEAPLIGDFDGDGIDDLLWAGAHDIRLAQGRGYTGFEGVRAFYSPPNDYGNGVSIYQIAHGEFDGDGQEDLVWAGPEFVDLYSLDGTMRLEEVDLPATWSFTGGNNVPLSIGDFDGDGRDDIVRCLPAQIFSLLRSDQGFTPDASPAPYQFLFPFFTPCHVGDFDGDGIDELALRHPSQGYTMVLDWALPGWIGTSYPASSMPSPAYLEVADVDGNGTDDLVYAGATSIGVERFLPPLEPVLDGVVTAGLALDRATASATVLVEGAPLVGAEVRAWITTPGGLPVLAEQIRLTDASGTATWAWALGFDIASGDYTVYLDVQPTEQTVGTLQTAPLRVEALNRFIDVPSLLPQIWGAPSLLLPATADGGFIEWYGTEACEVFGGLVQLRDVGTCELEAFVAGDAHHASASTIASFNVLPADLTLQVADAQRIYGQAPAYQVFPSGLAYDETLADLDGSVVFTGPGADAHVGSHPLSVGGLTSDRYTITVEEGVDRVLPAPLVVRAPSAVVTYGEPLPSTWSLAYDGFVLGETQTALTAAGTVGTDAGAQPAVGSWPTRPEGVEAADYEVLALPGVLEVVPAVLVVTAPVVVIDEGQPVPDFVLAYDGFQYSDDATIFAPPPAGVVDVSGTPAAGVYPVRIVGAAHPDYTVITQEGALVVQPASIETPPTPPGSKGCSTSSGPLAWAWMPLVLLALGSRRS